MINLQPSLWVRCIPHIEYKRSCHNTIIQCEDSNGKCKWHVTLPPTKADLETAYTITATSQKHGSINISDVLFGDVWVCSGQSNMGFNLQDVRNLHYAIMYMAA